MAGLSVNHIFILVCISLGFISSQTLQQICPTGWVLVRSRCYKVYDLKLTWHGAHSVCKRYGSNLATIRDVYTNNDISRTALQRGISDLWIGLHVDNRSSISSQWGDGEAVPFYLGFWGVNQPSLEKGHCVYSAMVGGQARWFYGSCEWKRNFVCETNACPEGSFRCHSSQCVNSAYVCDGKEDCLDASDEHNCTSHCRYHLTSASGEIKSPNFPSPYNPLHTCFWMIQADLGTYVQLKFISFSTEPGQDEVLILGGGATVSTSSLLARLSGEQDGYRVVSPNNFLILHFTSNAHTQLKGFHVWWTIVVNDVPSGGRREMATVLPSRLTSPLYPTLYLANQETLWILTTPKSRQIITIQVNEFDLQPEDSLLIRAGATADSPILQELSSANRPEKFIVSTTNAIYFLLRTSPNTQVNARGFSFSYIEGCKLVYDETHGYISSPGYDTVNYPNYVTCEWSISTPQRRRVTLIFDPVFQVEDPGDYIQIYDGPNDQARPFHGFELFGFSGDTAPVPKAAQLGQLFIRFKTNSIINRKGFAARFSQGCSVPRFNSHTHYQEKIADFDYGQVLTVYCDDGYSFNSEQFYDSLANGTLVKRSTVIMECLYGGIWSVPRIPQCVRNRCGDLPVISNGYLTGGTGHSPGDTATYTCAGETQGGTTVTCNTDGTWSAPPVCAGSGVVCPPLATPVNGRRVDVLGTYPSALSLVRFECDPGYEITGLPILLCNATGTWNGAAPQCQALTCQVPTIENGQTDSATAFVTLGTSIAVTCNSGYVIQGNNSAQCQPSRDFTQLPQCVDLDECGVTVCSPGHICTNTAGSYTCTCPTGFQSQGADCVDVDQCSMNNGNCDTDNGMCVERSDGYDCQCNTGYALYTSNGTMGYFIPPDETGLDPGDVYHINHTCVRVQCAVPPTYPNRIILFPQEIYRYGDIVKFACNPGNSIQGTSELECLASGQWNGAPPMCVLAVCPFDDVTSIANPATFSTNVRILFGETLTLTCVIDDDGTVERRYRTCQYDHVTASYRLLGDSYDCLRKVPSCGAPKLPPNATAVLHGNTVSSVGSSFRFVCQPFYAYRAVGASSTNTHNVTCEPDYTWTYGNLSCVPLTCNPPQPPPDGEIVVVHGNYMYNTDVRFQCVRPGFHLTTPYDIKCVQAEQGGAVVWNSTVPTCIDREQPSFPACPTAGVKVRLYDSASFPIPQASDNSGAVVNISVQPVNYHPSHPITGDVVVRYTATDHAGNTATCDVPVTVLDEEPPRIQCTGSRFIYVDDVVTTVMFTDTDVIASDNRGTPTVTFQPPSVSVSLKNNKENYTIVATATDAQGLSAKCFMQVVVTAKMCHPEHLRAPVNGQKSCSQTASGYRCVFSCHSDYSFLQAVPGVELVSECVKGGPWTISDIPQCASEGERGKRVDLRVQYSDVTSAPTPQCRQGYMTDIQSKMADMQSVLELLCTGIRVTDILANETSITPTYDGASRLLNMDLGIVMSPFGLLPSDYTSCSDRIISAFTQLPEVATTFHPLASVSAPQCPTLQGRPGIAQTADHCEGRGILSLVGGQTVCKLCPSGTSFNSTGQCQSCPVGTYQEQSGQITCEPCPQETTTDGASKALQTDCLRECPGDLISATGLPPCYQCPSNTYKLNSTHCTPCPPGTRYTGSDNPLLNNCTESACQYQLWKNQQMVGGTDIMTAVVGFDECQNSCNRFRKRFEKRQCRGFNFLRSVQICFLYDIIDSYQGTAMYDFYERVCPEITKSECFCATMCPAGSFSYHGYQPHCQPCPRGFITPGSGATMCQQCPPGETTTSPGSTFCVPASTVLCVPGPCGSRGQCHIAAHTEGCSCLPGLSGRYCDSRIDPCASQPCYNSGICQAGAGTTFSCSCSPGFTGGLCETNIDDCGADQCGLHGVCVDGIQTSRCQCMDGYTGADCKTVLTPACARYPCLNKGTCIPTNDYWRTCNCPPPYTGEDCERIIDTTPCDSSPCLNGGSCSDVGGLAQCSCLAGFHGYRCEMRNQTCSTRNCGVNSGCIDDPVSGLAWCVCQPGFTLSPGTAWTEWFDTDTPADGREVELVTSIRQKIGPVCFDVTLEQAECRIKGQTTLITSGDCTVKGISCTTGSCPDYEVRFRCADIVAFKDSTCAPTDHCSGRAPCENGGSCEHIPGEYRCRCIVGFTGSHCERLSNTCESQSCLNQGTCVMNSTGISCQCIPGYTGDRCESNPDDCLHGNCSEHTLRCEDGVDDYTCHCKAGWTGKNCTDNINECASNPCQQLGTCTDVINDYMCTCPPGWTGRNCDVIMDQCTVRDTCTGSTVCYTLFDDIHCSCAGVSSGSRCESYPDVCNILNPCVGGATCSSNGTSTICQCPHGMTGENCELLASAECQRVECLNGGTCRSANTGQVTCSCVNGYEGDRCERKTDPCLGVTCPLSATCMKAQQRHYCRCPVGKAQPDCTADLDPDYDVCFPASQTPGSASLPYSIPVTFTDGFTITLWVRFSLAGGTGTFLSLYHDLSDGRMTSTKPVLIINEQGVSCYLDNSEIKLPYTSVGPVINNGEWHSLVVTWHSTTAILYVVIDGTSQQQQEDFRQGLPMPTLIWLSLGSHALPVFSDISPSLAESSTFNGCVSQLNIYPRRLNIDSDPQLVTDRPQFVFPDPVLRWSEFEPEGSTLFVRPSTATLNSCASGTSSAPDCLKPRSLTDQPKMVSCPDNQFIEAPSGFVQVNWSEPVFEGASSMVSNLNSGGVFKGGSHNVVYEARDNQGNVAMCTFYIFVNEEMCPIQQAPRGDGTTTCQRRQGDWPFTACRVNCPVPDSRPVQPGPGLHTCGPGGDWSSLELTDGLYPPCGLYKGPANVDLKVKLRYRSTTTTCAELSTSLDTRIRQSIGRYNQRWGGVLCETQFCSGVDLTFNCNSFPYTDVEMTIHNVSPNLTSPAGTFTPKQILTRAGLDENLFTYNDIAGATPDVHTFDVTLTDHCPDGQVAIETNCYSCGPGTYHNTSTRTCDNCPRGQYQGQFGTVQCQDCGQGQTTEGVGNTSPLACSAICNIGEYFLAANQSCVSCPVGTYQNETGTFRCWPCPVGQSTGVTGAVSVLQCLDKCIAGRQRMGDEQCVPCPLGTYRSGQDGALCQECPPGLTTSTTGSTTPSQCDLVACPVGQYRDTTNVCKLCPVGSYQDQALQTSCVPCGGDRYRTDTEGASSSTQCKFFCESGSEAIDSNTRCQQCPIGQYKDNSIDVYGGCLPCLNGKLTQQMGATSVAQCTVDVTACPIGQQSVNAVCEDCPLGFYKDGGSVSTCQQCAPGFTTPATGARTPTDCTRFCPSGEEVVGGVCTSCPRATYKDNTEGLLSSCQPCPVQFITARPGATSSSLCTVRNCSAGYRLIESENRCQECGVGFFQSLPAQSQCQQCPQGTITVTATATVDTDCKVTCGAGLEDRTGRCEQCSVGFYKPQSGPDPCLQCPPSLRTTLLGATSLQDCDTAACDPGTYLDVSTNQCSPCGLGQYQPDQWQDRCIDCPPGLVTYTEGAVSRDKCVLECESGREYSQSSGNCEPCRQGYYRDVSDRQDQCQMCPTDRITPSTGATSIADCNIANCSAPGQYLDTSQNTCVDCPLGTFQNVRWSTACQTCPSGSTTKTTGATSTASCYRDCESGSQVLEQENRCVQCPIGQYRTRGATWACVLCDTGFTTQGSGSTSQSDCRIPICTPGTSYNKDSNTCVKCPVGSFQPVRNQQSCLPCPNNHTTDKDGALTRDTCYSFCGTKTSNCTGLTECVDRSYGFACQCKRGYTGNPNNCTHVCDLPSYCTNGGVCRKDTFPACLCPEYFSGETCELRIEPSSDINNTIIGVVIGVAVFLLLLALVLVGIYSGRRRREEHEDESFEETTNTDGISLAPSSFMTLRSSHAPYSVLKVTGTNYDPAFYSAKDQSEMDAGYLNYANDVVRM